VQTGYTYRDGTHPLAEAVVPHLREPARFGELDGTPVSAVVAKSGHSRVLAAPLRSGGTTIGVLFLYDRLGVDGFEDGELKVADALSREVVGFLERVELLQAIDGERRKLADILGNTSDGIFSIDADGTITSWNAGLAAMTGYPADEIIGTRHFGLLRPRDAAGRDVLLERWTELLDSPASLPADLQIVSSSGQAVWLSCSYSRIPAGTDDRGDVLVVVARNVTQARELERLKDDFVAVVSHELRTPLVPIKGWAQTLLNRGDRLSDDQRRTAVQSILAQAQKLESLVLNILEASRIEAGRADGDGVADVGSIVVRIVEDSLASRPDRVVRLRPPSVPCSVRGSAVWVERAVSNLLANAIKYSPDDEPVDIVISVVGDDVLVSVTDRGPGIAADAHERIFERFERLEETRKQTGTGLGLYITRRLARAMGGEVSVSSVPGAGSTFVLRLPVAPIGSVPSTSVVGAPGDGAASSGGSTELPEQRSKLRSVNVVNLR
jgi:PAS domain S-box-containing protein